MCTPSRSNATRSRSSSGADCHVRSCTVVFATTRRLTLLLLVPRPTTPAGRGSRLRAYWRVATPTSMCSTTRRFNGSVCARAWNVGSGTSRPSARTRGRETATLHPASTTSLGTVPARDAARAGTVRIPRTAQRRAILLQHRVEHAEARADHHLEEFAFVSTRSATSGRARTAGDSTAAIGRAMRDCFMAAPCWRACARGSSPLVYHEQ